MKRKKNMLFASWMILLAYIKDSLIGHPSAHCYAWISGDQYTIV